MHNSDSHSRVLLQFLVALFVFALVSLVAIELIRPYARTPLAEIFGLTMLAILVIPVTIMAYFYRPKVLLGSGARVLVYAIGALSSGFTLLSANGVWDQCFVIVNHFIKNYDPAAPSLVPTNENTIHFAFFCLAILTISLIALAMERPPLTEPQSSLLGDPTLLRSHRRHFDQIWLWLEALLFPLSFVLCMQLLQHKNFGHMENALPSPVDSYTKFTACVAMSTITSLSFAAIYYTFAAAFVWFRRRQSLREEYAMYAAAASIMLLSTLSLVCFLALTGVATAPRAPWAAIYTIMQIAVGQNPTGLAEDWAHIVVAAMIILSVCAVLDNGFELWSPGGLMSVENHYKSQKHEMTKMLSEGVKWWYRALSGVNLPEVYAPHSRNFESPLPAALDPLEAWKDRARELVQLSTTSYALGNEAQWHDLKQCWVGQNVDTSKAVLLFIVHDDNAEVLSAQISYLDSIALAPGVKIGDIIFASLFPIASPPQLAWESIAIQWKSESDLLDDLVDFRDYFHSIKKRVTIDTLADSSLTLADVFTESEILLPDKLSKANVEQYLTQWSNEPGRRQLALLGEYGQGKSSASLMWVYHSIQSRTPGRRLPLLIELRGLSPRTLTPEELLSVWGQRYNINPRALLRLVIAGRVVLIFEGFDEMDLVGDMDMRLRHFRSLWCFAFSNAKLLFTGRPNLFFETTEFEQALRTLGRVGDDQYCDVIVMQFFDTDQIANALRGHALEIRNQIVSRAKTSDSFKDLVSRPSLLHVVSSLWNDHRLFDKSSEELNSAYVMNLFVRASYRRQGLKTSAIRKDGIGPTLDELAYFMSGIAVYMAANGLENQISADRLRDAFDDLLNAIPDSVSTTPVVGNESKQPLKERVGSDELRREELFAIVHTSGLLVIDPAAIGRFAFSHKSFMEFLVADVMCNRILNDASIREAAICNATGATVSAVFKFPVAVQFFSELAGLQCRTSLVNLDKSHSHLTLSQRLFTAMVARPFTPGRVAAICIVALSRKAVEYKFNGDQIRRFLRWRLGYGLSFIFLLPASLIAVIGHASPLAMKVIATIVLIVWVLGFQVFGFRVLKNILGDVEGDNSVYRMCLSRLRAWRSICEHVPISHEVLHRVVGTRVCGFFRRTPLRLLSTAEIVCISKIASDIRGCGDSEKEIVLHEVVGELEELHMRYPAEVFTRKQAERLVRSLVAQSLRRNSIVSSLDAEFE